MKIKELHDLTGKVALVTGGARDLGLDAATALAESGCDLIITSRNLASAEKSARELSNSHNIQVLPLALDVSHYDQVKSAFDQSIQWQGHLDILVNNAGGSLGTKTNLLERSPEDIIELIMVNVVGSLFCAKEAARHMIPQGSGKIINIASIAALVGRDRRIYDKNNMNGQPVDYAAAKSAIIGMTRDLAGYLSPQGIHVNAISPGGFGPRDLSEGFQKDYGDLTPLNRMGRDGVDLKGAILYLASKASDYVTGHNLVVDGGFSIWK